MSGGVLAFTASYRARYLCADEVVVQSYEPVLRRKKTEMFWDFNAEKMDKLSQNGFDSGRQESLALQGSSSDRWRSL